MSSLLQTLSASVPFLNNARDKCLLIVVIGVFFPAFLIFFQPFGVNNYDQDHTITLDFVRLMSGYGLANGLVLALNEFVVRRFLPVHKKLWQLLLWTIWSLVSMSTTTFLLYNYLGNFHDWHLSSYLGFVKNVSGILLFPLVGVYFYFHFRYLRQQFYSLETEEQSGLGDQLIWLVAENGKDRVGITFSNLAYLQAFDNYVQVFYHENGGMKKRLLRSTLKRMETQLAAWHIMRCHRSYLVNLQWIDKVDQNGQKVVIKLKDVEQLIPVSQGYANKVFEKVTSTLR